MRTDGTGRVETVKRGQRGSPIRFVRAVRRKKRGMQRRDEVKGGESFRRFHHWAGGDQVLGAEATGGHLKAFYDEPRVATVRGAFVPSRPDVSAATRCLSIRCCLTVSFIHFFKNTSHSVAFFFLASIFYGSRLGFGGIFYSLSDWTDVGFFF